MPQSYRPIVLIPVYNHTARLPAIVETVRQADLPCLLIDDGSDMRCATIIDCVAQKGETDLIRLPQNSGKGAAVITGLQRCLEMQYTHALQIDADGQHDLSVITLFIETSKREPGALIGGMPIYGKDAPKNRLYGRWATRIWVWINTLSTNIPDGMCGFRIYPLRSTVDLIHAETLGKYMDFDTEILVRLAWRGVPMRWLPVRIYYPEDGISHFKLLRDNLRISWMHARLFFGMLLRLPKLLQQRWRNHRAA
ncbi:glycosyl transferase [Cephaloticoccus primus]|uniref:Glycosyl transferase n=1 Tax=Cephaloticoccus primus TaxID=1548207 RepID=A0A139SQY3_9BACT|nr:glycosyltransferase family 2 protein [Cephaloticoccus primus]KXU36861.1 glycosyl transferase [Cephaloticoccus primus]